MALQIKSINHLPKVDILIKCMSTKHYNYQYLQESKVPTMHFQASLPRLPIPKIEDTCKRYLAAQQPLLSTEKFGKTEENVKRFLTLEGDILQRMLVAEDKKNKHTSYISEPWFNMYLSDRTPLPINYNPIMVFKNDTKQQYNDQLLRSTNMLISSLRFMRSLRENILEPEVFHLNPVKSDTKKFRSITSKLPSYISWYGAYMFNAYPLDMSQYYKLFNSTRIPEIGKDRLYQDATARHILVMHRGNFYTFDVLDESGEILPADLILSRMAQILNNQANPVTSVPIGLLTTENRDTWAEARAHMESLGENKQLLQKIDSALFNLILDDQEVGSDIKRLVQHFLYEKGENRWFDKSFSLIVTKDGVAGVNFEHSWGDGVAVLRYFQDIYRDSIESPQVHPHTKLVAGESSVTNLRFNVDDTLNTYINEAKKSYQAVCDSLDVNFVVIDGVGKNACKKHSISPDALMQLGFQSAFYKQNKCFVPSYESCSTAAFKHGRTETIRPCTKATSLYSQKVHSREVTSKSDLLSLIINCSDTHKNLTKNAAMGQGFDRHLFALKLIAEKNRFPQLPIFNDPAYAAINKNIISSSTLNSPAIQAGGFGPVVPNGYGIAYMIMDEQLGSVVLNYHDKTDGQGFIDSMRYSFEQLKNVIL